MLTFFGKYAGQMAFSLIGTVLGALIVTKLGLYSPFAQAPQPASAIETPATAASEPAVRRIEDSHQAIRERLDANQAEANRIAEAERRAKADAEAAARTEEARAKTAALAAQERAREERARKAALAKREMTPTPVVASTQPVHAAGPVAPPVSIVPPPAPEPVLTRGNPFVDLADTVKSTAGKMRDKVVETLRLDRIFRKPAGDDEDTARSGDAGAPQRFSGRLDL